MSQSSQLKKILNPRFIQRVGAAWRDKIFPSNLFLSQVLVSMGLLLILGWNFMASKSGPSYPTKQINHEVPPPKTQVLQMAPPTWRKEMWFGNHGLPIASPETCINQSRENHTPNGHFLLISHSPNQPPHEHKNISNTWKQKTRETSCHMTTGNWIKVPHMEPA